MYPQLDYSDAATQMVDCSGEGNIQTYDVRSDDENNRKHSFIPNDDGTFKIKTTRKDNNTYYWKVENEQVKGDTNVDNSGSFILEEEIIDTSQSYLIKNVRSGYYLHREEVLKLKDSNDSDGDNNKNEEIEIPGFTTQIIQKNEVGLDSQFKFIPTGSYNEFYIVSADESYAFTTESVSANTLLKYSAFESADNQKFYYYIQEVSVDGYLLQNGNDEGFVRNINGNYYVDYEDGDGRKFIIENKAKIGIRLNKEWYDTEDNANDNTAQMIFAEGNEPNAEFEIYKSSYMGTPTKTGEDYFVNNTKLEKIADAKIDKNGEFEIYSGDKNNGDGTSKIISNQLHIFGTSQTYNGTTKGVFQNDSSNPLVNKGNYYDFSGKSNGTVRLWIKPTAFAGELVLTFQNVDEGDKILIHNNDTPNDEYAFDLYALKKETGNEVIITQTLKEKGNYRLTKQGGEPKLKSAVFYPYNYYYIREKNSDNCKLIGDDGNGFVVLQDTDKYYLNLSANSDDTRYPIITAKNVPKVNLDITKEWHNSNNEEIKTIDKSMRFQIYTAYENTISPNVNSLEEYKDILTVKTVNNTTSQITYNKEGGYYELTNGSLNIIDLPAFKEKDESYHKLYYYVREVEGNYTITNTNAKNGFIPYESEQYGTAYDDTSNNSGKYNFVNTPKLDITVNKKWLDAEGEPDERKGTIDFVIWQKTENGTSEKIKENGVDKIYTTILNQDNSMTVSLPAYNDSGEKYFYSIEEISRNDKSNGIIYYVDNYTITYSENNVSWEKYDKHPIINVTNQ